MVLVYNKNYVIYIVLGKFPTTSGTVNRQNTKLMLYKVKAFPVLSYGCEIGAKAKK